jgi:glutamine amidotransferase
MSIGILALDSSNFASVGRALKWLNKDVVFITNPELLDEVSHVILPGVSKFQSVMDELHSKNLVEGLERIKTKGTPILGLCAGMQVMGMSSEENSGVQGLNWFDFKVVSIVPRHDHSTRSFHTGWNEVRFRSITEFDGVPNVFYFNHSYFVQNTNCYTTIGETSYGEDFSSVIRKDNLVGAQFHPEKSQLAGLNFLHNFTQL